MKKFNYVETENGQVYRTQNPETWTGAKVLPQKEGEAKYKQQVGADLKDWLRDPCTVYTVLRHVSASGMQWEISLHVVDKTTGRLRNITYSASVIVDRSLGKLGGIIIKGCGMDIGFALVDDLLSALFPSLNWHAAGYWQEWI